MSEIKVLLSASEVEDALGICHSTFYVLINSGQLKSCKLGKRRMVTENQLAAFVASLEAQSEDAATAGSDQ